MFDLEVDARRNVVKRCIGFLKHNRGCAMWLGKLVVQFYAPVQVGCIRQWLKRLFVTGPRL